MVNLTSRGNFNNTFKFLQNVRKLDIRHILERYGRIGVERLREATPKDTGLTSESWVYEVRMVGNSGSIEWWNTNINDSVPIALILQYGHGTGWGAYVPGRDYINPALQPVFDELAEKVWEEVRRA